MLADLGGHQYLVSFSAPGQPSAQDDLGFAAGVARRPGRVDIGGVNQVSPGFDVGIEDPVAGLLIAGPSKGVSAKHQGEDIRIGIAKLCHESSFRERCIRPRFRRGLVRPSLLPSITLTMYFQSPERLRPKFEPQWC